MVKAIAPKAPMGAKRIKMATTPKTTRVRASKRSTSGFAARAGERQSKAEQKRDEQHLQDVSPSERIDNRVRNDVDEELRNTLGFGLAGIFGHGLSVQRRGIDVKTAAGTHQIAHNESNEQGKRRDCFEIQKGFAADAADFLHVLHAGDSGN